MNDGLVYLSTPYTCHLPNNKCMDKRFVGYDVVLQQIHVAIRLPYFLNYRHLSFLSGSTTLAFRHIKIIPAYE